MDTVSICRPSDVRAIVHDDARAGVPHRFDAGCNEAGERPGIEIPLADLDEVHAGARRGGDTVDESIDARAALPTTEAVGDHADHRLHLSSRTAERPMLTMASRSRRALKSDSSSTMAVPRFNRPSPVTAPRTKLLVTSRCSSGTDSAKYLRSQYTDQATTDRTIPTSKNSAMSSSRIIALRPASATALRPAGARRDIRRHRPRS